MSRPPEKSAPSALVVGAGGREHALSWALERSGRFEQVYVAPGNPGVRHPVPIPASDAGALASFARERSVSLCVIGPEAPLVAGVADRLREAGLAVVGPSQAAARIESSKAYAKQLMERAGVPTAPFRLFADPERAVAYVRKAGRPLVVKADGLAAGKGVFVCDTPDEAVEAVEALMVRRSLGEAGRMVVIEDRLRGPELSVMVLTDGVSSSALPPARDHKRLLDGDRGPNTGGMGAVAPVPPRGDRASPDVILETIIHPVLRQLAGEGTLYRGILYAGLMLTPEGPMVLEFNCRGGDPETQAQLPLLDPAALVEGLLAVAGVPGHALVPGPLLPAGEPGAAVCVVLASAGYPASPRTGDPIEGLDSLPGDAIVFHAGTRRERDGRLVTAGGRVLNVVGLDANLDGARRRAYEACATIRFEGMQYRRDIGLTAPSS